MKTNNWKHLNISKVADLNVANLKNVGSFSEYLYLDTSSVTKGFFSIPESFTKNKLPSRAKRKVRNNDIIISTVRPNQKHYGFIQNPAKNLLVSTGFCVVSAKDYCDSKFLYFYLTNDTITEKLQSIAEGSTTAYPSFKPSVIENLTICLPPLPEQRAIAAILSNIDDKIENNLAINKTLEEMAMALYKHWFVDFGPFQDRKFIESELGMIPEGWEVKDLRSIINLNPRLSIKKGEIASFVEMKALPVDRMSVSEVAQKEFKSGTKFQNGDTLFARITPCLENGKTAFVDFLDSKEIGFGSTEFLILRAHEGYSKYWNYCLSRTQDFRSHAISCMVGTSGRQRVQNDPLMNFEVARAPRSVYQDFEKTVEPLFKKIRHNTIENQTLKAQRDALLPKLVNGEVRVKGFE